MTASNDNLKTEENQSEGNNQNKGSKIFALAFAAASVIVSVFIVKSGLRAHPYIPSENPFYTESINYPPDGTWKAALLGFLLSASLYLLADAFLLYKLRGWKKSLSVLIWIMAIAASTEAAAGLFIKNNPPLHRPHPSYLWEVQPNQKGRTNLGGEIRNIEVNSYGFRGPAVSLKKPAGVFRIMVLGDSSAFGYGVNQEEVFADRLEKILQRQIPDRKIEVINAAVSGYTTFSTLRSFREKGIKFKPDAIILSHNNDPDYDWDTDKNRAPSPFFLPVLRILYKSNVYMLLRKNVLNQTLKRQKHLYNRPPRAKAIHRVPPDEFRDNLNRLFKLCRDQGIKIMVISMPRREDEDYDTSLYRGIMEKTTDEAGGIFVDTFHRWKEFDSEELFMDGMHPYAEGHGRIADELADAILKAGWITKSE